MQKPCETEKVQKVSAWLASGAGYWALGTCALHWLPTRFWGAFTALLLSAKIQTV